MDTPSQVCNNTPPVTPAPPALSTTSVDSPAPSYHSIPASFGSSSLSLIDSFSKKLRTAEQRFSRQIQLELNSLLSQGIQQHICVMMLLKRLSEPHELPLPDKEELEKVLTMYCELTEEQALRALIVRSELRRLKSSGYDSVRAVECLTLKVTDMIKASSKYDEHELQELWNRIFDNYHVSYENDNDLDNTNEEQETSSKFDKDSLSGEIKNMKYKSHKRSGRDLEKRKLKMKLKSASPHSSKQKRKAGIVGRDVSSDTAAVVMNYSHIKKRRSNERDSELDFGFADVDIGVGFDVAEVDKVAGKSKKYKRIKRSNRNSHLTHEDREGTIDRDDNNRGNSRSPPRSGNSTGKSKTQA